MSLLTDLMSAPLEGGYAEATARRRAAGLPAGSLRPTITVVIGLLLVGLLLAVAAVQARVRAPRVETARAALVEEVRQRTDATDRLEADVDRLRDEVAATRKERLATTGSGADLAAALAPLELVSGLAAVVGPGVVVTVDDAETAEELAGGDPRERQEADQGRVRDSDLHSIVNGIWEAGAEAISVNDQRLTSTSAIRSAGEAILVAYRPLSPPYVVRVIGDPMDLESQLLDGPAGAYLQVLRDNYGIRYAIDRADRLKLPGASGIDLRWAEVAAPRTATPTNIGAAQENRS